MRCLDAPVSGGDIGARNGKLAVMVGGEAAALTAVEPLLKCYSALIQHMGGPGYGQHAKMANQIMIAGQMIGTVEGLIYGHKAGLPLVQMIDVLSKGAASSL